MAAKSKAAPKRQSGASSSGAAGSNDARPAPREPGSRQAIKESNAYFARTTYELSTNAPKLQNIGHPNLYLPDLPQLDDNAMDDLVDNATTETWDQVKNALDALHGHYGKFFEDATQVVDSLTRTPKQINNALALLSRDLCHNLATIEINEDEYRLMFQRIQLVIDVIEIEHMEHPHFRRLCTASSRAQLYLEDSEHRKAVLVAMRQKKGKYERTDENEERD